MISKIGRVLLFYGLCLLLGASLSYGQSKWIKFGSSTDGIGYFDFASIVKLPNKNIRFWMKQVANPGHYQKIYSPELGKAIEVREMKYLCEVSPSVREWRITRKVLASTSGSYVPDDTKVEDWDPIVPDSSIDTVWQIIKIQQGL